MSTEHASDVLPILSDAHHGFDPALRGYDRAQVDQYLGQLEDEVRWLCAKGRELLDAHARERPSARLRTFAEVEALWRELVEPELASFQTMQPRRANQPEPVPAGSVWAVNAAVPELRPR